MMNVKVTGERVYHEGTAAQRAAFDPDRIKAQEEFFETDTGGTYRCLNTVGGVISWQQTGGGGATHVQTEGFKPSSYTGKITSSPEGTVFVIASGTTSLKLESLELTALSEFAVIAFGTSAVEAQTNLGKTGAAPGTVSNTGAITRSGSTVAAPQTHILGVPVNARDGGYAALGNGTAGNDQVVMVTQGRGGI